MSRIQTALLAGVVALFIALASHAHHASAAYDLEQFVEVTGTVSRWQFINPHSGLWIQAENESGEIVEWAGEFQGTLDLYRHFRFNKDTFLPGDTVTLGGYPARDGSESMSVRIVGFSDGSEVDVRSAPD